MTTPTKSAEHERTAREMICNQPDTELLIKQVTAIIAERDSWKEKFTTLNKELMCELRDPNGTIWDVARELQDKNDKLESQLTSLKSVAGELADEIKETRGKDLIPSPALTAYNQWLKENE